MTHKSVAVKVGEVVKNYGVMIFYKLVKFYELAKIYKVIKKLQSHKTR